VAPNGTTVAVIPKMMRAQTSAHGLIGISRQDDEAEALVLFGDRVTQG
jgi:hypothetical protein